MSMPPAHDACGAMRARPVHAAPILRAGRWLAVPMPPRALAYGAALILLMLLSVALALTLGAQGLSWRELPTVLAGGGTPVQQWLAYTLRLPRAGRAGRGRGAGLSGALFQSVTRNPLGSPDVIGLTAGASAGAVATAMVWPGLLPVAWGAAAGALLAMAAVWFGSGAGFAAPQRMVVAGIAVGALALAFVQYALSNLRREQAHLAATWLNGNLAGKTWSDAQLIALACAVLLPLAMAPGRAPAATGDGRRTGPRAGRAAPAHARRGHADRGTGRRRRRQRRRPGGLRRAGRAADRPALRARQRPCRWPPP